MKCNKIRISGGSGSGKSYLGKKLEKLTGIKYTRMDAIAYDLSKNKRFDEKNKRPFSERKKMLKNVVKRKKWIIEGGYYTDAEFTYDEADLLIMLRPSLAKRIGNTVKRFFRRIWQGEYEGIINFIKLLIFNIESRKKWQTERCELFSKKYAKKYKCFRSADEAYGWFVRNYKKV